MTFPKLAYFLKPLENRVKLKVRDNINPWTKLRVVCMLCAVLYVSSSIQWSKHYYLCHEETQTLGILSSLFNVTTSLLIRIKKWNFYTLFLLWVCYSPGTTLCFWVNWVSQFLNGSWCIYNMTFLSILNCGKYDSDFLKIQNL